MRILLVEDEERLSQALVEIFKKNRISNDEVLNGTDGLSYALSGSYDAVILDIMLPDYASRHGRHKRAKKIARGAQQCARAAFDGKRRRCRQNSRVG